MKYRIYWHNFGYGPSDSFDSIEAAVSKAQEGGFEAVIIGDKTGETVAFYSPLHGLKVYS
jgi:hypothetical protein